MLIFGQVNKAIGEGDFYRCGICIDHVPSALWLGM